MSFGSGVYPTLSPGASLVAECNKCWLHEFISAIRRRNCTGYQACICISFAARSSKAACQLQGTDRCKAILDVTPEGNCSLRSMGLIDAEDAAEILAVPKTWILAEARAGRMPHVRLGRYVRFDPSELRLWALSRSRGPRLEEKASSEQWTAE